MPTVLTIPLSHASHRDFLIAKALARKSRPKSKGERYGEHMLENASLLWLDWRALLETKFEDRRPELVGAYFKAFEDLKMCTRGDRRQFRYLPKLVADVEETIWRFVDAKSDQAPKGGIQRAKKSETTLSLRLNDETKEFAAAAAAGSGRTLRLWAGDVVSACSRVAISKALYKRREDRGQPLRNRELVVGWTRMLHASGALPKRDSELDTIYSELEDVLELICFDMSEEALSACMDDMRDMDEMNELIKMLEGGPSSF